MIAGIVVVTIWVAAAFIEGQHGAASFTTQAECREAAAKLEAIMYADGAGDGDLISGCYAVTLREPAVGS